MSLAEKLDKFSETVGNIGIGFIIAVVAVIAISITAEIVSTAIVILSLLLKAIFK